SPVSSGVLLSPGSVACRSVGGHPALVGGGPGSAIPTRQQDALDPCIVDDHAGGALAVTRARSRDLARRELRVLVWNVVIGGHCPIDSTPDLAAFPPFEAPKAESFIGLPSNLEGGT